LLLLICILGLLFLFFRCVGVHGSGHRSTLKNRGNIGFGEQNASANSSVLDAVGANDPPKRLGAYLEHLRRVFGSEDFHERGMATKWSVRGKNPKPRRIISMRSTLGCQKSVIVADVVLQLSGVVSTVS
jgi:hypothetical protein